MQTKIEKIDPSVKKVVEEYQCPGCTNGSNISCYQKQSTGVGCEMHSAGTFMGSIGKIFLGMPKGFNRVGPWEQMSIEIFPKFKDYAAYNLFNVPAWKYLNEHGHTIVRGICPRISKPFLHIFLEDCRHQIECLEIQQKHLDKMD